VTCRQLLDHLRDQPDEPVALSAETQTCRAVLATSSHQTITMPQYLRLSNLVFPHFWPRAMKTRAFSKATRNLRRYVASHARILTLP
jgi:hypothetical protein